MKRLTLLTIAVFALGLTACGGGGDDEDAAAKVLGRVTSVTTGSGSGGSTTDLCETYSALEIEQRIGIPVEDGSVAGPGGTACQWDAKDEDGAHVQIQVIDDTQYWEKPSLAAGYEEKTGIGTEAFVVPELGGWKAGALTDASVAYVSMVGGSSSEDTTVELLRDLLDRLAG